MMRSKNFVSLRQASSTFYSHFDLMAPDSTSGGPPWQSPSIKFVKISQAGVLFLNRVPEPLRKKAADLLETHKLYFNCLILLL